MGKEIKYSRKNMRFSILQKIQQALKRLYMRGFETENIIPARIAPYFPILILAIVVATCEIISASMMFVYSGIYGAIAGNNTMEFWRIIFLSLFLSIAQACAEATKTYCTDNLALIWRKLLIEELERAIRKTLRNAAHHPERLLPPVDHYHSTADPTAQLFTYLGNVSNLDQRVTQDVTELCSTVAKMISKVILLPFVVLFYAYYLTVAIGLASPFLCLAYFLISLKVSYSFAQKVSPVIYQQGKYEGDFRLQWTQVMTQWLLITLWQGGGKEISLSNNRFRFVWDNQKLLLKRQWRLNMATQGFQYAGAIVTYAIVGLSVLYLTNKHDIAEDDDVAGAKIVIRWTRGSYAAMALIHAFTTVTDALGWWSTATGLANRILVVLFASKPIVAHDTRDDSDASNGRKKKTNGCCCVKESTINEYQSVSNPTHSQKKEENNDHDLSYDEDKIDDINSEANNDSNGSSNLLDREHREDPWGLWTLFEEVKRSRTIHSLLYNNPTSNNNYTHGVNRAISSPLKTAVKPGGVIQLQPWSSNNFKPLTNSTPSAAATEEEEEEEDAISFSMDSHLDDNKDVNDNDNIKFHGLYIETPVLGVMETGYAQIFQQQMMLYPLSLQKPLDLSGDKDLEEQSPLAEGVFNNDHDDNNEGNVYYYDNRFRNVHHVLSQLENQVYISQQTPVREFFQIFEYSLYSPTNNNNKVMQIFNHFGNNNNTKNKEKSNKNGSLQSPHRSISYNDETIPPKRLLIAQLTFSMTSQTRLLISGPTGSGKSTFLFALTQQLRAFNMTHSTHRPFFQHIVVPLSQRQDRFRVIHCPQTPYILPDASLLENVFYPKTLHLFHYGNHNIHHNLTVAQALKEEHQIALACELLVLVGLISRANQPYSPSASFTEMSSSPYIFASKWNETVETKVVDRDNVASTCCSDRTVHSQAAFLSLGEQQCLSMARLLFHYIRSSVSRVSDCKSTSKSPSVPFVSSPGSGQLHTIVLLDEVTSAMDEECEENIYHLLQRFVPAYISVGHRSTIRPFHKQELKLSKQNPADWKFISLN